MVYDVLQPVPKPDREKAFNEKTEIGFYGVYEKATHRKQVATSNGQINICCNFMVKDSQNES